MAKGAHQIRYLNEKLMHHFLVCCKITLCLRTLLNQNIEDFADYDEVQNNLSEFYMR